MKILKMDQSSASGISKDELVKKILAKVNTLDNDEILKKIMSVLPDTSLNASVNEEVTEPKSSDDSDEDVARHEDGHLSSTIQTYKRRVGTTDSGRDYEHKMLTLLSIRCILQKPENFWLVTNADNIGDFDDIILHIKMEEKPATTYMLQMKHEDKQSDLTQSDFTHKNKPFNLVKHAKGFTALKETLKSSNKSSDSMENLDPDNIRSVFFTNRVVPSSGLGFLQKSNDVFLNTNPKDHVYTFDFTKIGVSLANEDYCKHIYFLSNQINETEAEMCIAQEVGNLIKHLGLTKAKVSSKNIAQKFKEHVTKWAKCKLEDVRYLTKEEILTKFAELLLCEYALDLKHEPCTFYDCPRKAIWNSIMEDKVLTIVEHDQTTVGFMKEYLGSELKKYLKVENTWGSNLSNKNKRVFYKKHKHLCVDRHENVTMFEIYKHLWLDHKIPLVLQIGNTEEYHNILKILTRCNFSLKIIIITKVPLTSNNFSTLCDLNLEHREAILGQSVSLQGRTGHTLGELIDESDYDLIKCRDLIYILSGHYNIGNIYKSTDAYFVERIMHITMVKFEALEIKNELFLIHDKTDKFQYKADNIIITKDMHSINVEELKSRAKVIHKLIFKGDNFLEWQESFGSTNNIKKHLLLPSLSQDEIFSVRNASDTEYSDGDDSNSDASRDLSDLEVFDVEDGDFSDPEGTVKSVSDFPSDRGASDFDISERESDIESEQSCFEVSDREASDNEDFVPKTEEASYLKMSVSEVFNKVHNYSNFEASGSDDCVPKTFKDVSNSKTSNVEAAGSEILNKVPVLADSVASDEKDLVLKTSLISNLQMSNMESHGSEVSQIFHVSPDFEASYEKDRDALKTSKEFSHSKIPGSEVSNKVHVSSDFEVSAGNNLVLQASLVSSLQMLNMKSPGSGVSKSDEKASNMSKYAIEASTSKISKPSQSSSGPENDSFSNDVYAINKIQDDMKNTLNNTHILSGCPGMGKSVLVDYITNKAPLNTWVIKIILNDHDSYYENSTFKSAFDHVKYFNEAILNQSYCLNLELANSVFEKLLNAKNIIFLIDGFDEVSVSYKYQVTEIAKSLHELGYHMWITTRPHMNSHLEQQFNTIATTLKPFTQHDQKRFFIKYFTEITSDQNQIIINEFTDKLLQAAKNNLNDWNYKFMGVPLQSKLLADVFSSELKASVLNGSAMLNDKFNTLYLYEEFIRQKTEILCLKHGKCAKEIRFYFHNYQKLLALKILFNKHNLYELNIDKQLNDYYRNNPEGIQILQREGLLVVYADTDSKQMFNAKFVHRTFAEYLSAQWLVENYNSKDKKIKNTAEILIENRFRHKLVYNFLFRIFDSILSKGLALHSQIINGEVPACIETLKSQPDVVYEFDCGNRSVVHLIALYGLPKNQAHIIGQIPSDTLMKYDNYGYNPLDYAIKNWSLDIANKICEQTLDIPINIASDEYKTYMKMLHHILDCDALSKKLSEYFICYECLENSVDENLNLYDYFKKSCESKRMLEQIYGYLKNVEVETLAQLFKKIEAKSAEGFEHLQLAVAFGSEDNVKRLVSEGADVNGRFFGHLAICCGIKRNKPNILQILEMLAMKMDINASCADGNTPLHGACQGSDTPLVEALLKKGAEINKRNKSGKTPLFVALEHQNIPVSKLLLEHNAETDNVDRKDNSLLHLAAKRDQSDIILQLIHRGLDINKQNKHGETPLFFAVKHKHTSVVKLLLKHDAQADVTDRHGNSCLHFAAKSGQTDIVLQLINKALDVNQQNITGDTPLFLALKNKKIAIAKLLLRHNAEISDNVDWLGNSYIHSAAAEKGENVILELIQKGLDINKRNEVNTTPLFIALQNQNIATAKLLLENNAQVDDVDFSGNTCMHWAAQAGENCIILELIHKGLDINKQNANGETPLFFALCHKHVTAANLLLQRGAIFNTRAINGSCHLHYAAWGGCLQEWLKALPKIENFNLPNVRNETPLHYSLIKENFVDDSDVEDQLSTIYFLVKNGADVNSQDYQGNTALHLVSGHVREERTLRNYFYEKVSELLIDADIDMNLRNQHDYTALDLANSSGQRKIASLIQQKVKNKLKD